MRVVLFGHARSPLFNGMFLYYFLLVSFNGMLLVCEANISKHSAYKGQNSISLDKLTHLHFLMNEVQKVFKSKFFNKISSL